jgi:integrase
MTVIKLRYVDRYIDATGKTRFYFRRSRRSLRVALPGYPGSEEFMAAYQAALDGDTRKQQPQWGAPGTFDRLVQDYFASPNFLTLAPSSQRAYRLVIERFVRDEKIGHRLVSQMTRAHVQKMLARRSATPGAANDLLKKIRILVGFAIEHGLRRDDPTIRMRKFAKGEGFHTWTDAEIEAFEKRWGAGTKERLAFALLLYTGQRRSDVVRMSLRDLDGDSIWVAQQKVRGTKLLILLHPHLKALLSDWPKDHLVILATGRGKPFSAASFGMWMAKKIAAAGLPDHCVTHGLRKAAARRLAEAGCSTLQIMSVTGHKSLSEVERYTRDAQQKRLAIQAIDQLSRQSENKDSLKRAND